MTREEHISNLKTIACDGWNVTTDEYKSLQFAINVLEQQNELFKSGLLKDCEVCKAEQEPCEDAVSRQQAISSIRNLYPGRPFVKLNLKKWQEENKKYFECENIIKALPSVTPTRRKKEDEE